MEENTEIRDIYSMIEGRIGTQEFEVGGVNCWPIIRNGIIAGFSQDRNASSVQPQETRCRENIKSRLKKPFRQFKLRLARRKFIRGIKPPDGTMQFCVYPNNLFTDELEGRKYCRYTDPYFETLKKRFPSISYFGFLEAGEAKSQTYHPIQFHRLDDFVDYLQLKQFLDRLDPAADLPRQKLCGTLEKINEFIHEKYGKRPLGAAIINECLYVSAYKEYFDHFFSKSQIRTVFIEDFTIALQMAMCAAAKERNIRVVEIQHGVFDDRYFWFNGGRSPNVLPDQLWCWSEDDRKKVEDNNSRNFPCFRPFAAGNMWLKKYVQHEIPESVSDKQFFSSLRRGYSRTVLVTLQPQIQLTDLMVEVIRQCPADVLFLVRFHPLRTSVEERNKIMLALAGFRNVEISRTTNASLYQLFQHCDLHLTHSSAAALEALSFNLPSIICSPEGERYFRRQIEDKVMFYSTNGGSIMSMIVSGVSIDDGKKGRYLIKTDEAGALEIVSEVLKNEDLFA